MNILGCLVTLSFTIQNTSTTAQLPKIELKQNRTQPQFIMHNLCKSLITFPTTLRMKWFKRHVKDNSFPTHPPKITIFWCTNKCQYIFEMPLFLGLFLALKAFFSNYKSTHSSQNYLWHTPHPYNPWFYSKCIDNHENSTNLITRVLLIT